jgi:uncharacterized protein (TIGR02145 family)
MRKNILLLTAIFIATVMVFIACNSAASADSDQCDTATGTMSNQASDALSANDSTANADGTTGATGKTAAESDVSSDQNSTSSASDGDLSSSTSTSKASRATAEPKSRIVGCNDTSVPGWGASLGTISFASSETWTIGAQTWSDAVQATNCNKTSFNGGTSSNYSFDCRSNPEYKGDLFSWCAVFHFAAKLCPAPWRVPTADDFVALNIALDGTGDNNQRSAALRNGYLNLWSGVYGGGCNSGGALFNQGSNADYWSQSENKAGFGLRTSFASSVLVSPQSTGDKSYGFSLRCVR